MSHRILHVPLRYGPSAKHYLVFFVTGNPGLIAYYRTFLATLDHLLSPVSSNDDSSSPAFHIFGQSLPGFEDDDGISSGPATERSTPYGLQEEIDLTFDLLKAQKISSGNRKGQSFDGTILIGHSVGSYILLELLGKARQASLSESLNVKAGILLFPTVTHIAQSPSGIKFSALFQIPGFPRIVSLLVRNLFWPLPRTVLRWLVATVTRMPEDAAGVTTNLLVGKRALWQAL
jgi:pimeloyl-ACP methyl ester carboxylesterase